MHFLLFTEASQLQKKCSSGKGKPERLLSHFMRKYFLASFSATFAFIHPKTPTPNPSLCIDGEPDALKWNFMAKYTNNEIAEKLLQPIQLEIVGESLKENCWMPSHSEKALWKRLRKPKMLMKIIKLGLPKATENEEKTSPSSASSKTFNLKFKLKILSQQQLLIRS